MMSKRHRVCVSSSAQERKPQEQSRSRSRLLHDYWLEFILNDSVGRTQGSRDRGGVPWSQIELAFSCLGDEGSAHVLYTQKPWMVSTLCSLDNEKRE